MTPKQRSMKGIMQDLRRESPELDLLLRARWPRHQLALALVALRRHAGLSQQQVAESMGRSQRYVARMEYAGSRYPSAESIRRYARACRGTVGYILVTPAGDEPAQVLMAPLGAPEDAEIIRAAIRNGALPDAD